MKLATFQGIIMKLFLMRYQMLFAEKVCTDIKYHTLADFKWIMILFRLENSYEINMLYE